MGKPSLSVKEQIELLLESRGVHDSRGELSRALLDHGYFRLSGYWRYFQVNPAAKINTFQHGTDFADIFTIYRQDDAFRNLMLEGLSEIEIALRAVMTAFMCSAGGDGDEYLSPATYISRTNSDGNQMRSLLLSDIARDIARSKERHVIHYRQKHGTQIPMWVATEALSFGILSRMYGLLADQGKRDAIAARFGYTDGLTAARFTNNLRAVAVFRNACAHHSRIWNRQIKTDVPFIPRTLVSPGRSAIHYRNTAWGVASVAAHMVAAIRRNSTFLDEITALASRLPSYMAGLTEPKHM